MVAMCGSEQLDTIAPDKVALSSPGLNGQLLKVAIRYRTHKKKKSMGYSLDILEIKHIFFKCVKQGRGEYLPGSLEIL